MRNKILLTLTALFISCPMCSVTSNAAENTYENTRYVYSYKDGNTNHTGFRRKIYSGSEKPHGYAYAICTDGNPSSVKLTQAEAVSYAPKNCSEYVTIPKMTHTNIRNTFNKSKYKYAVLYVRDHTNNGSTRGYWSPDSSKQYGHIVG